MNSSGKHDVLFSISTKSIAIVGTSAVIMRRSAFAIAKSAFFKTNFIESFVSSVISILHLLVICNFCAD